MDIQGIYINTISRNEKTGYTSFSFKPNFGDVMPNEYGLIIVRGFIQKLPDNIPLTISCGKFENNDFCYCMKSYSLLNSNVSDTQKFLSSSYFPGIGKAMAKKICDITDNLANMPGTSDFIKQLEKNKPVSKKMVQSIEKLTAIFDTKYIFDYVIKLKGSVEQVEKFLTIYKNNSIDILKSNPYLLTTIGIPFDVCDTALKDKIGQYNSKRISTLLNSAWSSVVSQGNTCTELSEFYRICTKIEQKSEITQHTGLFYLAALFNENHFNIRKINGKYYIQKDTYEEMENSIFWSINRICSKTNRYEVLNDDIEEIENILNISYSNEQKIAFGLLEKSGIKILTGGPGTGKTTVLNGMIKFFEGKYPNKQIKLCAPTGCAAKRMSETTGKKAYTIHKLLEIKPFKDGFIQSKNEHNFLSADIIIVDECSMIDTELFSMFLRAVKNGATVLLLGDECQLPSVGAGTVLKDLIASEKIETCRLTKIFRQQEGSLIINNSIRIKDGNIELVTGSNYIIHKCKTKEDALDMVIKEFCNNYDTSNPLNTRLFTPVKNCKYLLSSTEINKKLHSLLVKDDLDEIQYGNYTYSRNEPVIFNANNYEKGYMNGDVGIVTAIFEENNKKVMQINIDGEVITLSDADISNIMPAYAVTIHKAQGSECKTAIIVLPEKPENMLIRSLLYVAATRATKKVIIIEHGNAITKAIKNNKEFNRTTGLNDFLQNLKIA